MKNFRNKRLLIIMGILVLLTLVFTGCATDVPEEQVEDPIEEEQVEEPAEEEQVEEPIEEETTDEGF